MQFKTIMTVMLVSGASLLIACGDSSDTESRSGMDTREVTKQSSPQTPTLNQRVEATPLPQRSADPSEAPVAETSIAKKPAEMNAADTTVVVASGQSLYASCMGCHGATGSGGVGRQLTGKTKDFLVARMKAYRAGEQVGPMTAMMAPMASGMTDEQIDRVVDYILTF